MTAQTMTCPPCAHAAKSGWWGSDLAGTHCESCHRSWTGKTEAHCASCCEHFGSIEPFDIHLEQCTGDPASTRERLADLARSNGNPVLALRQRASGPVWVRWRFGAHPFESEVAG